MLGPTAVSETHTNAEGLQREHWFGIIYGKDFCGTRVEVRWSLGTQEYEAVI